MEMFSAVLRAELLQKEDSENWKVRSIQPGVVDTQMQDIIRSTDEEHFPMVEKFHELKRTGKLFDTIEVARALHKIIENPDELESWQHRIEF
jgi:NADP-dependent 3-hydroxy acid dehydrogenase YdfG